MANTKISALTAATAALAADELPVNESGTTKKVTVQQLTTLMGTIRNYSTSAQTPSATTRTYIAGSAIAAPSDGFKIGTILRWKIDLTKTAAGTASSTIDICFGTAGTTADTARVSFTKPGGSAVADAGIITITAIVRGPLSASCIVAGTFQMTHNLQSTGHMTIPTACVVTVSSAFDITTAGMIAGVCITSGSSDAITIQTCIAEAQNL